MAAYVPTPPTPSQASDIERALDRAEHEHGAMTTGGRQRFRAARLQQLRANPHQHEIEDIAGRCLTPYGWDRVDFREIGVTDLNDLLRRTYAAGAARGRGSMIGGTTTNGQPPQPPADPAPAPTAPPATQTIAAEFIAKADLLARVIDEGIALHQTYPIWNQAADDARSEYRQIRAKVTEG